MLTSSELLTTRQVAEILAVSPRTVARLANESQLETVAKAPGKRGAMFFERKEVEHYKTMRELQTAGATK